MNKYDFIIPKVNIKTQIMRILIISISVFLCLILPINGILYSLNENKINSTVLYEKKIHEILLNELINFRASVKSDINILNDDYLFRNFISNPNYENKILLQRRLYEFVKYKNYYSQLRYINLSGKEVIRINSDGDKVSIVNESNLQDKSERYYFKEMLNLEKDDIYLSNLDLNIENEEIEMPLSPMIRLGRKVYSDDGTLMGILILNYKAMPLVEDFMSLNEIKPEYNHYIIDNYGNYLFHEIPEYTWGNYFNSRSNFKIDNNSLMSKMTKDKYFVKGKNSIFIYTYVSEFTMLDNPNIIYITEIPKHHYTLFTSNYIIIMVFIWLVVSSLLTLAYNQVKLKSHMKSVISIIYHGIDQNPVIAILTDSQGNIVYVNEAFENLTGYSFRDVYKQNPNILKSGKMEDREYKNMWDTIRSGKSWNGEFYNKCKDGSYYWAEARISPILNDSGHIDHYFAIQTNVTHKKNIFKKYQDLALKDPLTGAFNRNVYSLDENKGLIEEVLSENKSMIYMIDIDHFKQINDKYGHDVGDEILEKIVEHISNEIREDDLIIRYGGEEFLLILSIHDLEDGFEFGNRIRTDFMNNPIMTSQGGVPVRISLGMTRPRCDKEDINLIIKRADQALYEAKNTGRNKLVYRE